VAEVDGEVTVTGIQQWHKAQQHGVKPNPKPVPRIPHLSRFLARRIDCRILASSQEVLAISHSTIVFLELLPKFVKLDVWVRGCALYLRRWGEMEEVWRDL